MNTRAFELPKTWAAVKSSFRNPINKELRGKIIDRAYTGDIGPMNDVILTDNGRASLEEIRQTFIAEMQELGLFDKDGFPLYTIGEDARGIAVAFLDQPIQDYEPDAPEGYHDEPEPSPHVKDGIVY